MSAAVGIARHEARDREVERDRGPRRDEVEAEPAQRDVHGAAFRFASASLGTSVVSTMRRSGSRCGDSGAYGCSADGKPLEAARAEDAPGWVRDQRDRGREGHEARLELRDERVLEREVVRDLEAREQVVDGGIAEAVPVAARHLAERPHGAARHEPAVEAVRVRPLDRPGDRQIELAASEARVPGAELVRAQLDVEAERPEIVRDDVPGAHPVRPAVDDLDVEAERPPVVRAPDAVAAARVAALVEQPVRRREVLLDPRIRGQLRRAPGRVRVGQPRAVGRPRVASTSATSTIFGRSMPMLMASRHAHVVEGRARRVRVEERHAAHEREPVVIVLGIAAHERPLDRRHEVARPVDVALDERQVRLLVGGVGEKTQRLDARPAGLPVERVLAELVDLGCGRRAPSRERPRADGARVREGHGIGDVTPDVRGHDRLLRDVGQAGHVDPPEAQLDGERIERAHVLQEVPDVALIERAVIAQEVERVHDVGRREAGAVRPARLAQREPQAEVISRPGVARREPGHVGAGHGVEDEQRLEDARARGEARALARRERVEVAHPRALLLDGDREDPRRDVGRAAATELPRPARAAPPAMIPAGAGRPRADARKPAARERGAAPPRATGDRGMRGAASYSPVRPSSLANNT